MMLRKKIISIAKKKMGRKNLDTIKFEITNNGNLTAWVDGQITPTSEITDNEFEELKSHLGNFLIMTGEITQEAVTIKIERENGIDTYSL